MIPSTFGQGDSNFSRNVRLNAGDTPQAIPRKSTSVHNAYVFEILIFREKKQDRCATRTKKQDLILKLFKTLQTAELRYVGDIPRKLKKKGRCKTKLHKAHIGLFKFQSDINDFQT